MQEGYEVAEDDKQGEIVPSSAPACNKSTGIKRTSNLVCVSYTKSEDLPWLNGLGIAITFQLLTVL